MPIRRSLPFAALLVATACSGLSKEARIERKLESAGVKPKLARCLAPKLARDLSDDQLHTLAAVAKQPAPDGGHGRKALAEKLANVNDPQIADVVSRAALSCAIMG